MHACTAMHFEFVWFHGPWVFNANPKVAYNQTSKTFVLVTDSAIIPELTNATKNKKYCRNNVFILDKGNQEGFTNERQWCQISIYKIQWCTERNGWTQFSVHR